AASPDFNRMEWLATLRLRPARHAEPPPLQGPCKGRVDSSHRNSSNSSCIQEHHMAHQAIFGPFFATMLLTLIVCVHMYVSRIYFITASKVSPQDLAVPGELARRSPPAVSNPSDNLKNLFEMPVLFYALTLYLFATGQADTGYVCAGWIFAAFRALHSAVHCTFNLVILRFWLYAVSTIALWFMVIRAALNYFAVP